MVMIWQVGIVKGKLLKLARFWRWGWVIGALGAARLADYAADALFGDLNGKWF